MLLSNTKYHENLRASIKWVLNVLKKGGYKWIDLEYINNNRYVLVKGNKRPNILITYKREVFFNFSKQFPDEKGAGDSINIEHLRYAIRNKVKSIIAIFPNDKIYFIKLHDFLCKSFSWTNKEGKSIRSTSIHNYIPIQNIKGVFG